MIFWDLYTNSIRTISAGLRGFTGDSILVRSRDGQRVYSFDTKRRHLTTRHALTGSLLYSFGYDSEGRLESVTDGDGNITSVTRELAGEPTGIKTPFGQLTALTLDPNGYLASVTNPAGEVYGFVYSMSGLFGGADGTLLLVSGGGALRIDTSALGPHASITGLAEDSSGEL